MKLIVLRCSFYKGVNPREDYRTRTLVHFSRFVVYRFYYNRPTDFSAQKAFTAPLFFFSRRKNRRSLNGPVGLRSLGQEFTMLPFDLPLRTIEILSCVWRNSVKCTFSRALGWITALFEEKCKWKRHTRTLSRYKANYWILYGKQGTDWSV